MYEVTTIHNNYATMGSSTKSQHSSLIYHSQQTLKSYEEIATIPQIWNSTKFYVLYASASHGTKYEENPSIHHGGMCGDEQVDGQKGR